MRARAPDEEQDAFESGTARAVIRIAGPVPPYRGIQCPLVTNPEPSVLAHSPFSSSLDSARITQLRARAPENKLYASSSCCGVYIRCTQSVIFPLPLSHSLSVRRDLLQIVIAVYGNCIIMYTNRIFFFFSHRVHRATHRDDDDGRGVSPTIYLLT